MNELVRATGKTLNKVVALSQESAIENFLGVDLPDMELVSGQSVELFDRTAMENLMLERAPFFFVERAVAIKDGDGVYRTVYGIANIDERQTAGHFPGRPIVPLIELCKSMAQTGIVLAALQGDMAHAPIAISAGKSKATAKDLIDAPVTILTKVVLKQSRKRLHFVDGTTYAVGADKAIAEIGTLSDILYTLISREDLLRKS